MAGAGSGVRMRPPGDLKLARSLSKSDSDLLLSPPGEEEGGLGYRSESVSNCSTGKKRLEKSPSFTSEWDEVSICSQERLFNVYYGYALFVGMKNLLNLELDLNE